MKGKQLHQMYQKCTIYEEYLQNALDNKTGGGLHQT
jgi:hypothetical protein